MINPSLDRESIRERTVIQPVVSEGELVSDAEALAFYEDLKRSNPIFYRHIQQVIESVDGALAEELGAEVHPMIRRGIVARAAIRGSAQSISDTGAAIINVADFRASLGIETDQIPHLEL